MSEQEDQTRDFVRGLMGRPSLADEAASAEAEAADPNPLAGGVAPNEGKTASPPPEDQGKEYVRELFRRARMDPIDW